MYLLSNNFFALALQKCSICCCVCLFNYIQGDPKCVVLVRFPYLIGLLRYSKSSDHLLFIK